MTDCQKENQKGTGKDRMSVSQLFSHWRQVVKPGNNWGLAWFLAYEFCRRYYSSHGISPFVLEKEGLGYYGILLESIPCRINKESVRYGRMTVGGNVENWRSGSPGDHGLPAIEMCASGVPTEEIVERAIVHMGLPAVPRASHYNCRHKRWGGSYELCFEIAAILALRNASAGISIWNHPYHTKRLIEKIDPLAAMPEHPGMFLFVLHDRKLMLAGDGRLLDGSEQNLWHMYMNGRSAAMLAGEIEKRIGL